MRGREMCISDTFLMNLSNTTKRVSTYLFKKSVNFVKKRIALSLRAKSLSMNTLISRRKRDIVIENIFLGRTVLVVIPFT